jgi:hypothetical protein
MGKGYTAMVLTPFIQGMTDAGSDVELFYTSRLKVKPCTCGEMYCWYKKPGECCIKDDMQLLYPKLREADILVLATPVYIPLPGGMQDIITGGWWEKGNFGTVVRIAEEFAEDASVEFAGAVLRPHAFLMKEQGQLTEEGGAVLNAVKRAGYELVNDGVVGEETLETISRPLISEDELRRRYNQML